MSIVLVYVALVKQLDHVLALAIMPRPDLFNDRCLGGSCNNNKYLLLNSTDGIHLPGKGEGQSIPSLVRLFPHLLQEHCNSFRQGIRYANLCTYILHTALLAVPDSLVG